jgi:hypothetical protein
MNMSTVKIKVGDKVKKRNGDMFSNYKHVVTVIRVDAGVVWFKETNTNLNAYGMLGIELVTLAYPNAPHKHAKTIKAWADGADIESLQSTGRWFVIDAPMWAIRNEYRIKPAAPVKSDKDIQIEALEKQAKQLAADIAKLKS